MSETSEQDNSDKGEPLNEESAVAMLKVMTEQLQAAVSKADLDVGEMGGLLTTASRLHKELTELHAELLIDRANDEGEQIPSLQNRVNKSSAQIEKMYESIEELHGRLLVSKEGDSLSDEIDAAHLDANNKHKEIVQMHSELLKDEYDEDDNFVKTSTKTQLQILNTEMELQVKEFKQRRSDADKDFSKLRSELEEKILSLLPSAAAAGFGAAFHDAKSHYGPVPAKGVWYRQFWHNFMMLAKLVFFYGMFIGPLAILFFEFGLPLVQDPTVLESIGWKGLALRLVSAVPLGLISYFGFSSIRLNRRMYEEYNYKQRVMELYDGFKKEVKDSGDKNQAKQLLDIMLTAVAAKPSKEMANYDGNIKEFLQVMNPIKPSRNSEKAVANVKGPEGDGD